MHQDFVARCCAQARLGLCRPSSGVRPSVRLSDTFADSVETNKHIFKFVSPSGSHTILVFHTKCYGDIPTVACGAGPDVMFLPGNLE